MKTVKTYLIRKPEDINEVISMSERYPERAIEVEISETIELTAKQYNYICKNPFEDYNFLTGKGGYKDGYLQVIELTCKGKQPLYANPEGSSYCRYLGIKVED
ncbi:MAG: hypothetical protein IJS88_04540 [Alphaproteobacteria bacterium]|nr:hypothetical protein [Alphaproteobacteria bacterium]